MTSRNGKIAKLPIQLREQIDLRISEGATLKSLLGWLNSDPAVLNILNTHFGGRPISQQNMSEWRLGGYEEWLVNQQCFSNARAFSERRKFVDCSGISADDLLVVLTARWTRFMEKMGDMDSLTYGATMGSLRELTKSASILRKLELQKARLELDRETRQPKGGKKGAAASSSPESTAPSAPNSPESGSENSLQSDPSSGGSLFSRGVPCDPDEMIELADGELVDEEEEAWQALGDPPAPPKPLPNPYANMLGIGRRPRTPSRPTRILHCLPTHPGIPKNPFPCWARKRGSWRYYRRASKPASARSQSALPAESDDEAAFAEIPADLGLQST